MPHSESDTSFKMAEVNRGTPSSAFLTRHATANNTPHSKSHTTSKVAEVNGETPSSAFLAHLVLYPIISDAISTFKSNPYSAKSLSFVRSTIDSLSKPYEYVSLYIKKADSLGDATLSTLDNKYPCIKKPTEEIYEYGKSIAILPLKRGNETKEYVLGTYEEEVKKVGCKGLFTYGKAAVATGLIISGDAYSLLVSFLGAKKEAKAKEAVIDETSN